MSYDYSGYVTELSKMLVVGASDAYFQAVLPAFIDYAEQRIYRDLDLLTTVVRDQSATLSANVRDFTLPQVAGRFVVVNAINLMSGGQRVKALRPVSLEYLDACYPASTAAASDSVPEYFAMVTDQTTVIAPPSGTSYTVECVGTIRPEPLSESNTTTYLTLYLPDLFLAASMVFGTGYQRNFGAQADDPKMGSSWEAQYQSLLVSANTEENRKKWQSVSWTSKSPSPIAQPQRG